MVTAAEASTAPRVRADVERKPVPCNLCGSMDTQPFCPENGRSLVQCQNCGLVYVSPRPDAHELYALYGESYFHNDDSGTVGYTNYIHDEANIRKTFQRRLKRVERFATPGRLLDVGCAAGFFLSEAQARGWEPNGLDVSHFAATYTRDRFGIPAQQGSLLDLDYPDASFDMVTMWDVIEHVPDPAAHIQKIARLLPPGGHFALATPDVASLPAKLTGKRWVGYKLQEEHVYYFSAATLSAMLDKAGFDVLDVYHVGKYVTFDLFFNRLSMYSSILAGMGSWVERAFKLN
ncbi:MAG TPA: class I SAM-dependent methyltransferase, partial [Candidatus Limnocylindrales bacterium]|nr:class I SAM-dependent methyltransferase [Candidatus Limnocylindrales bacterium]